MCSSSSVKDGSLILSILCIDSSLSVISFYCLLSVLFCLYRKLSMGNMVFMVMSFGSTYTTSHHTITSMFTSHTSSTLHQRLWLARHISCMMSSIISKTFHQTIIKRRPSASVWRSLAHCGRHLTRILQTLITKLAKNLNRGRQNGLFFDVDAWLYAITIIFAHMYSDHQKSKFLIIQLLKFLVGVCVCVYVCHTCTVT